MLGVMAPETKGLKKTGMDSELVPHFELWTELWLLGTKNPVSRHDWSGNVKGLRAQVAQLSGPKEHQGRWGWGHEVKGKQQSSLSIY